MPNAHAADELVTRHLKELVNCRPRRAMLAVREALILLSAELSR
jgi:hypothetical protein